MNLLDVYLVGLIMWSLSSSVMYLAFPGSTAEFYGGTATPFVELFVNLASGGYIIVAYLAYEALYSHNFGVKSLVVRATSAYLCFHMGALLFDNFVRTNHPYGVCMYIIVLGISMLAAWWWGVKHKPIDYTGLPT
ncbi:unnamed protein product [Choristocarpus tenellus]